MLIIIINIALEINISKIGNIKEDFDRAIIVFVAGYNYLFY